jgi:hypothetical protein
MEAAHPSKAHNKPITPRSVRTQEIITWTRPSEKTWTYNTHIWLLVTMVHILRVHTQMQEIFWREHLEYILSSWGGWRGRHTDYAKQWIILLDTDSHRIHRHVSTNNLLLLVCEKLILRWSKIIFAYLTTCNKLKYCTWSLKIYYQLPLIHRASFNVSLSMAWITDFFNEQQAYLPEIQMPFPPSSSNYFT